MTWGVHSLEKLAEHSAFTNGIKIAMKAN